jgi:hypothetical protein
MKEAKYVGMAEYVSRPARMRLVELCINAIEKEQEADEGPKQPWRPLAPTTILARELGVSARTIRRWLNAGYQACDVNATLILKVSMGHDPEGAIGTLKDDLEKHRQELDMFTRRGLP